MLKTKLTEKALQIATNAHQGQTDKAGQPYIHHPMYLAKQMETEDEVCVALLHDVVEDTDITLDALIAEDFPISVTDAIALLTHNDDTEYMDYIRKIKSNQLAAKVKLADLRHNSDVSRLQHVDDKAKQRLEKYSLAIAFLEEF